MKKSNWFSVFSCLLLTFTWSQVCTGLGPFAAIGPIVKAAMFLSQGVKEQKGPTLKEVDSKLRDLSNDFQDFRNDIMDIITNDLQDKLTEKTNDFFDCVKDIEFTYGRFINYWKNPKGYEKSTIKDFAKASTSTSPIELRRTLEKMYEAFVGRDIKGDGLLSIIAKRSTANDLICIKQESKQQLINDLFQVFVESSIKGLLILQYSYDVLTKFKKNKSSSKQPYHTERAEVQETFETRVSEAASHFKSFMKVSSREVWNCDPEQQEKGVTYEKLQVYQAYFIDELDAIIDGHVLYGYAGALALNTCPKMKDVFLNCATDKCRAQPPNKRCDGHIRNCVKMPNSFQVCHSPADSDRKYDWMREDMDKDVADYGRFYPNCQDTQGFHGGYVFLFRDDICLCTCESNKRLTPRHFSLKKVLSDVDENKVVTGVQLVRDGNVFHIKIQQGELGPNGTITGEPEHLMVDSIVQSELSSNKVVEAQVTRGKPGEGMFEISINNFKKNNLVYTVTEQTHRVYLDTLDAGPNRVVTGVRFQHVDNSLRLEIHTTAFDYATGILDATASSWVFNENGDDQRTEAVLTQPDDPLRVTTLNQVVSIHNQFVDFRMTDWAKDLGQQTVPFIDTRKVIATPLMPLSGVGLVLRGQKYSGGFLAPEVIHYDYTDHM